MKKISLFILSVFAVGVSLAQAVSDFDFVPTTTDNNMSVVFPAGTLSDFVGGSLMAFKADGSPVSAASAVAEDGSGGIAAIGTDAMCGCDYLSGGDQLVFAILLDSEIIVITDVDPPLTYAANTFEMISGSLDFTIDGAPVTTGCTDAAYLEHWDYDVEAKSLIPLNPEPNLDDGSFCDNFVFGCMSQWADNFDPEATIDDGSCNIYSACQNQNCCSFLSLSPISSICYGIDYPCEDCSDDCIISHGCTNPDAINYDPFHIVDDGSCVIESN